jgi:hypothetical protein
VTIESYGIEALRGGARKEASDFLGKLRAIGLFIVPKGELEGWWPDGSTDKAEWAVQVIEALNTKPHSFSEARSFVNSICDYINQASQREMDNIDTSN